MSILVIDDEASLRRSLRAYLEDLDHEVLEAENGKQGIEIAEENVDSLEAVILDLNMPVMNGFSFLPVFVEKMPDTPVIVLSGVGVVDEAIKAIKLGAWDYVTKPLLDFELMELAIGRAIEKAELRKLKKRYVSDLEEKVKERTAKLAQSQKKAEQASAAKSLFLNNLGHEFRTPMNHIMGFCDVYTEMEKDPEKLEILQIVKAASTKLLSILENLLDLSSLESNKVEFQYESFDLIFKLNELAKQYSAMAEEKNVQFSMNLIGDLPQKVFGPSSEITQALSNVLLNAVRYTESGEIVFDVEASDKDSQEAITIHFTVVDTGKGILPEKLDNIFDSFEIGEELMTKRLSGAGVGLTITKLIVEKIGGSVWVKSEIGKGSTFHISLPLSATS